MHLSKTYSFALFLLTGLCTILFSFRGNNTVSVYSEHFQKSIQRLLTEEEKLIEQIRKSDLSNEVDKTNIRIQLQLTRNIFKPADFWLRYLNSISQKKINGPLPVEWETEVFEKFEKPYRREGAGFTLAYQYLEEKHPDKNVLIGLIEQARSGTEVFFADSITAELVSFHHFYFCNRLFLLNLAAIYTTGFDCPDADNIVPELRIMLSEVEKTYSLFNSSFPETPLSQSYLTLYNETIDFVNKQPDSYEEFDHYTFIRNFVNPLYALNAQHVLQYKASSRNLLDYSLNKKATSIFSKSLYNGQNSKGIFLRLQDSSLLKELEATGKLLFYDPILSSNNQRSCASCHNPTQYYTDTFTTTAMHLNKRDHLPRNTPSLLNVTFNHLLMADGQHYTLTGQAKSVITNIDEMGCSEAEALRKVLSCKQYATTFKKLLVYTPQEKEITLEHIASAITYYYSKFSNSYAPFDDAMNKQTNLSASAQQGFNVFMGKAQCATCHFVPIFNGVKPPYIGSEFEVIGVPAGTDYSSISTDKGRYIINPAEETLHAFRTGTIRNAAHTSPYMHNGIFKTLEDVIEFYNQGGGAGKGMHVPNQTLSSDSLQLTQAEKEQLIAFMQSLTETIPIETAPSELPVSKHKPLNNRNVSGTY